ncbi:hypothetical protein, partial [Sphingomonas asaccharolytica]|uniref:hypothetical protein n=1 Tax=Sphingomonas asaccharolytica TaxID=40681 RepID=UPI001C3F6FFD
MPVAIAASIIEPAQTVSAVANRAMLPPDSNRQRLFHYLQLGNGNYLINQQIAFILGASLPGASASYCAPP